MWNGLYSGLYNSHKAGMVPKPTEECLGQWIVNDLIEFKEFRVKMITDYWHVPVSEYQKAWYSAGDLMFKNFDACHFKAVLEDVNAYCANTVSNSNGVKPSKYEPEVVDNSET